MRVHLRVCVFGWCLYLSLSLSVCVYSNFMSVCCCCYLLAFIYVCRQQHRVESERHCIGNIISSSFSYSFAIHTVIHTKQSKQQATTTTTHLFFFFLKKNPEIAHLNVSQIERKIQKKNIRETTTTTATKAAAAPARGRRKNKTKKNIHSFCA